MNYVRAAKELPNMDESEIAQWARDYHVKEGDEEDARSSDGSFKEKKTQKENLFPEATAQNAQA